MLQWIQFLEVHGSEPAELIVLNPEPDLDAVPVGVEQRIMERTIMRYGDWKRMKKKRGGPRGREREKG